MNKLLTKVSTKALNNLEDIRAGFKSLVYKDPHRRVKYETTYCPRETPEERSSGYTFVPLEIEEVLTNANLYADNREREIEAKRFEYHKSLRTGMPLPSGKQAGKHNKHIHPYSWDPEDYLFGDEYDKAEKAYEVNQWKAIAILLLGIGAIIAGIVLATKNLLR